MLTVLPGAEATNNWRIDSSGAGRSNVVRSGKLAVAICIWIGHLEYVVVQPVDKY